MIAAPVVCYEALLGDHEHYLAKGERGVIALVAQDARGTPERPAGADGRAPKGSFSQPCGKLYPA